LLLTSLDELQVSDWDVTDFSGIPFSKGRIEAEKLSLILKSVCSLRVVLGDYLHVLVPAFLKLSESLANLNLSESMVVDLSVLLYRTISALLESQKSPVSSTSLAYFSDDKFTSLVSSESGLPSRVVQPLIRILSEKPPGNQAVGLSIIECLCVCSKLIGGSKWVQLYDGVVRQAITQWENSFVIVPRVEASSSSILVDEALVSAVQVYDDAIDFLLGSSSNKDVSSIFQRTQSLVTESPNIRNDFSLLNTNLDNFEEAYEQPASILQSTANQRRVNQSNSNLQRAWDVSQRASRDDWDEWMRRLAIQLLREAPSPALRACASLAHAYQPLARELFNAAFACCWQELSPPYRANLVHALETAFVADVSPEILQQLLNLAEFMEHDPNGGLLTLSDIPILADLALKCRAYAKALHYREREYKNAACNACVESLISINRKLDLQGKQHF
jgi:hypothetical protein